MTSAIHNNSEFAKLILEHIHYILVWGQAFGSIS